MSSAKHADFFARLDSRLAEYRHRQAEKDAERAAMFAARRAQQPVAAPIASQPKPTTDIEAQARREYELSTALPGEFGSVETYIAFRKAEAAGRVKIFGAHIHRG